MGYSIIIYKNKNKMYFSDFFLFFFLRKAETSYSGGFAVDAGAIPSLGPQLCTRNFPSGLQRLCSKETRESITQGVCGRCWSPPSKGTPTRHAELSLRLAKVVFAAYSARTPLPALFLTRPLPQIQLDSFNLSFKKKGKSDNLKGGCGRCWRPPFKRNVLHPFTWADLQFEHRGICVD
jgi:hypothetical protein